MLTLRLTLRLNRHTIPDAEESGEKPPQESRLGGIEDMWLQQDNSGVPPCLRSPCSRGQTQSVDGPGREFSSKLQRTNNSRLAWAESGENALPGVGVLKQKPGHGSGDAHVRLAQGPEQPSERLPARRLCEVLDEVLVLQFPTQRRLLRQSILGVRPGFQD